MENSTFDNLGKDYDELLRKSIGKYGKDISYYAESKALCMFQASIIKPAQILEFGCGTGRNLSFLKKYFPHADIYGYDISEKNLEIARLNHPEITILGKKEISEKKNCFDMILVSCTLHHIALENRNEVINNIKSLLKDNGEVFIFEHNPYNPLTVHLANNSPIDKGAFLLKPKETINRLVKADLKVMKMRYYLFFPAALKCFRSIERMFYFIPLGGQYFVQAKKGIKITST